MYADHMIDFCVLFLSHHDTYVMLNLNKLVYVLTVMLSTIHAITVTVSLSSSHCFLNSVQYIKAIIVPNTGL